MEPYGYFGDSQVNRQRCHEILERAGGFNGLTANEAYEVGLHCPDLFHGIVSGGLSGYEPVYASPIDYGGGGGEPVYADPASAPIEEPIVEFQEPLWAGPEEEVLTDPFSYAPTTGGNGALAALLGFGTSLINTLGAPSQLAQTRVPTQGGLPTIGEVRVIQPQIEAGVTVRAGGPRCSPKRVRARLIRQADGTLLPSIVCAPRRMNPLNPRALARAGRRVGRFCAIASGMQSMLQKVVSKGCKPKRRASNFGRSCGPKRGCR